MHKSNPFVISFAQGMICVLQISTRSEDFIIDALELRDDLYVLNEVFTNPKIVKVFHGSYSDITSLQRDLSLYVVKLFDTAIAFKKVNELSALPSLKELVRTHCNVSIEKSTRLSDWRVRPLTEKQQLYARQDTHYLLYLYDKVRTDPNYVSASRSVFDECRELSKLLYRKPDPIHPEKIYTRSGKSLKKDQYRVFFDLFMWREEVARTEDESRCYILSNDLLFNIAAAMPKNEKELLDCCASKHVPRTLRRHKLDILRIVS